MKNFEMRKRLYEMMGEIIICSNKFINRHLMNNSVMAGKLITEIYYLLNNPSVSGFSEIDIESDDFVLQRMSFLEKEIEEYFINAYSTAETVETHISEKEIEEDIASFMELVPEPKKEKATEFPDMFSEES